ncbi:hypothetical protein [Blastococcus mobilis]|uniref:Uncharacterized protein n=1 Tax=Blastococcus mobilis TaxID=1938746 RepID=A0A239AXS3_9ACTN|nr:hypothetical protein [Blastococcus mobilis]SNR99824.1 hypothetical protein SAMN06272737_1615 [Blastococcus mobilis]
MSWSLAGLLLVAAASLGVLAGVLPVRVRTWVLAGFVGLPAALAFLPWVCVTAIASTPFGDPGDLRGATSCTTVYGAGLPDLGALDQGATGRLLALVAAGTAMAAVAATRRHRGRREEP